MVAFAHGATGSAPAEATSAAPIDDANPVVTLDDDEAHAVDSFKRSQEALYDTLAADSSPRTQILTLEVYIPNDDATPSALRPKRETVAARAVDFAPDDAFVQWLAATNGDYSSSRCGPTHWPETEVSNLVRLEPDNAGAWLFAVAIAQAKGEEAAVDETLSRMAAAPRADDHLVDEISAWKSVYAAHPELAKGGFLDDDDDAYNPSQKATL